MFAAVVKAVYLSYNKSVKKVDVFGDDIVVTDDIYHRVVHLLTLIGCKVNTAKSFLEGPFKESCGHDYFRGLNIRGVYCKRYKSMQDTYALINLLNQFTARTGLILSNAVAWLLRRVDRSVEIPCWEDPSGGIQMPLSMVRTRRMSRETFGHMYSLYVFKPKRARIREEKIGPVRGRFILFNPDGLYLAFVHGVALSSGLPLREQGSWKKKRRCDSAWNSLGASPELRLGFGHRQWETAVYCNIFL
jgi:hypothetical protein